MGQDSAAFDGFAEKLPRVLAGLRAHNTREWFAALGPLYALLCQAAEV
ncbi:MAG: hypothetical protein AB1505_01735 [Candidatus Latescibacterota bacterium]